MGLYHVQMCLLCTFGQLIYFYWHKQGKWCTSASRRWFLLVEKQAKMFTRISSTLEKLWWNNHTSGIWWAMLDLLQRVCRFVSVSLIQSDQRVCNGKFLTFWPHCTSTCNTNIKAYFTTNWSVYFICVSSYLFIGHFHLSLNSPDMVVFWPQPMHMCCLVRPLNCMSCFSCLCLLYLCLWLPAPVCAALCSMWVVFEFAYINTFDWCGTQWHRRCIKLLWCRESWAGRQSLRFTNQLRFPLLPMGTSFG